MNVTKILMFNVPVTSIIWLVHLNFAEVIKEKGIENVTVEDLVAGITPKGRGIVFAGQLIPLHLLVCT